MGGRPVAHRGRGTLTGKPDELSAKRRRAATAASTRYVPDSPALLTGAAGVALALLSSAQPIEGTDWDRTLLIT
ncbi:MAG TPA: hypothetical protein VGN81_09015 [Pseudonocardiaceae bacterium]